MFTVSDRNPNEGIGGRGCLCNPLGCADTAGPFAIFPATETDNNTSPHAVLCLGCALQFVEKVEGDPSEILSAGEPVYDLPEEDCIAETSVPTIESPVVSDEDIEL